MIHPLVKEALDQCSEVVPMAHEAIVRLRNDIAQKAALLDHAADVMETFDDASAEAWLSRYRAYLGEDPRQELQVSKLGKGKDHVRGYEGTEKIMADISREMADDQFVTMRAGDIAKLRAENARLTALVEEARDRVESMATHGEIYYGWCEDYVRRVTWRSRAGEGK